MIDESLTLVQCLLHSPYSTRSPDRLQHAGTCVLPYDSYHSHSAHVRRMKGILIAGARPAESRGSYLEVQVDVVEKETVMSQKGWRPR